MNTYKSFSRNRLLLGLIVLLAALLSLAACSSDNTPTSWSFAVLCDSRAGYSTDPAQYAADNGTSPYFTNVAKALAREKGLDFVIYPGDLIRGKKPTLTGAQMTADLTTWETFMKPVYDANLPVYYVRGNHDAYEVSDPTGSNGNATTIWKKFMATLTALVKNPDAITQDSNQSGYSYSFMHNGSLFVGLDEYVNTDSSYDQTFLKAQLAQQADHKFVFMHQPVWNDVSSELAVNASTMSDDMKNGNVDVYFSGHVHSYQRITKTGYVFTELILGTAGAPQDDPVLTPDDATNSGTQNLTVKSYAGGAGTNARFGYAIITVNSDGTVTSVVKFLDNPTDPNSTVTAFDAATIVAKK